MRALIVKFSSIGDCVMAVPVAAALKRHQAELSWAVDPRCAAVLEPSLLKEVFEIPWETWKREKASTLTQLRYYLRLRERKFDVGFDLQGHAKTAICLRLSGARRRTSARAFDPLVKLLNGVAPSRGAVHTVERNLEAAATLVEISEEPEFTMPETPSVMLPDNLVTIAVSTGHPRKNYPHWAAVSRGLTAMNLAPVYLGGPGDTVPGEGLSQVGKLSLAESMAWVRGSRIHLAADTGTGHIAAAYGTPVISIFGWTDPALFRPYGPHVTVLDAGKSMDALAPEAILAEVKRQCGI